MLPLGIPRNPVLNSPRGQKWWTMIDLLKPLVTNCFHDLRFFFHLTEYRRNHLQFLAITEVHLIGAQIDLMQAHHSLNSLTCSCACASSNCPLRHIATRNRNRTVAMLFAGDGG